MTTPSPSPPISLLPPSTGERLARCTAPPTHSSPPPIPSPLLPSSGCPTQIQTLRIASTQAFINAVTVTLPSPPLPPLPQSLYIPNTLYEVGRVLLFRPTRDSTMIRGGVNTELQSLLSSMRWTKDFVCLTRGDSMDGGGGGLCFLRGLGSHRDWSRGHNQSFRPTHDLWYANETHLQVIRHRYSTGVLHLDTASGTDGRDSSCDERQETRDGRHADRVASSARIVES
ncbi:hypothetical protein Tco_0067551 [Tanacetum coccineum]